MSSSTLHDGIRVTRAAFTPDEVEALRAGVEAATDRAVGLARGPGVHTVASDLGHRIDVVPGPPPVSVHWEPDAPVVRNLRPVAPLDARLHACWTDPRLTGPAAELLGIPAVGPLTSKTSLKRARVGSAYIWHTDHSFLARFLDPARAAEVVTAMILLDDADDANGALTLVPGSHRDWPRPDGEPPRPGDGEPLLVEAPAGSVAFFPSTTVHRSGPNRSARDRRALLYLFQPAGRPELDESERAAEHD